MKKAKYRCLKALNKAFFKKNVSFSLYDLQKLIDGPKVPQQTLSHILRDTPGIIKINGSRNTRYLYEDLKDYSAIIPITLETPNAELSLQTIKAKLISEHDVLILKRKKNRIVRILHCIASGPIKNSLSARIADEIQIEFTAWQILTSKYKTPLLPKVRLYRNKHIDLLLVLDYSNMISSVTSGCFDTNIKRLGSTYGEISDMDNEIRNEILEYYKIINGNDYIGNLTFFVGPDLRLKCKPRYCQSSLTRKSENFLEYSRRSFEMQRTKYYRPTDKSAFKNMINLSCIANILRKHHFTSIIITIWIQKTANRRFF